MTAGPVGLVDRARTQPRRTLLRWLLALAVAWMLALTFGGETTEGISVPGSDSALAFDQAIDSSVGEAFGATAVAVFRGRDGPIDADGAAAIDRALIDLAASGDYTDPDRPFVEGTTSDDGRFAFVEIRLSSSNDPDEGDHRRLLRLDDQLDEFGIDVEIGGLLPDVVADPAPAALEYLGIVVALVVLWRAFGSFRLAAWPILAAGGAVGIAMGMLQFATRFVAIPSSAFQLAALVGLGVGIDYGLLLVTRWGGPDEAPSRTGGPIAAVALAAGTVIVSILGLAVLGIPFFTVTAVATALSVSLVLYASVTVLPALLVLGRVDAARSWVGRRSDRHAHFLDRVTRRPAAWLAAGLAVTVVLAAPVAGLTLGQVDASAAPLDESRRVAHDQLVEEFGPGYVTPLLVTVDFTDANTWRRGPITDEVRAAVAEVEGVERNLEILWGREAAEAVFRVIPTTTLDSSTGGSVLDDVRAAVSETVEGTGVGAHVGGDVATRVDVARRVESRLGWMIATVIALSTILLIAVWRAPVLALKAALVNMCSVAAAYGVLVAVFQWGWGASLIGLTATVPIDPMVPVFLFAILFGLSMDYEVFLIGAVQERFDAGDDDRRAIVEGLARVRRVVLVAAVVMTAVFAGFITGSDPVTKMFGVGLVAAVVVDASVGRGLLVPTALTLLGRRNRWAPAWLTRERG